MSRIVTSGIRWELYIM